MLEMDSSFGSRHRAALGITRISGAISIVVSETNGKLSIAKDGVFLQVFDQDSFSSQLESELIKF
jgi:diadenylate cyclase